MAKIRLGYTRLNTGKSNEMKLQNRTILVTGGTSGVGRELVKQLVQKKNSVIVISRNPVNLECLHREFPSVRTYQCSLANGMDIEKTISDISKDFPCLSVVINNAGIQETPTFLDKSFSYDGIENEVNINLIAPIKICALMLGNLLNLQEKAAFVNITSGLALFPKKTSAVYCATKAGLHNFSRSFRYQLEETNVDVFEAILPIVDTPMTEGRGKGKISAAKAASAIISGIEKGKEEIYVGKSRLIPMLARISPSLMTGIMKKN